MSAATHSYLVYAYLLAQSVISRTLINILTRLPVTASVKHESEKDQTEVYMGKISLFGDILGRIRISEFKWDLFGHLKGSMLCEQIRYFV